MSDDPAPGLQGLRVLVVEDETLVAMLLEDMLGDLGCQVVGVASRVAAAVEMAPPKIPSGRSTWRSWT